MPVVGLGTNIAALKAQRRLADSNSSYLTSMERLSSGMRINRASDDAAGLAISSALTTSTRVFSQAVRNVNDGISYLNIAEGGLSQLSEIVIRQRELAEQSANGVFSTAQRRELDREANRLVDEYNRILQGTESNGRKVLQELDQGTELRIQAGYGLDGSLAVKLDGTATVTTTTSGEGDGTFLARSTYSSQIGWEIASADINNDGNYDLFTTSFSAGSNSIQVLLGNSDGSFKAASNYSHLAPLGGDSTHIVTSDFDSDGVLDVLVSAYHQLNYALFFGNSDGSLKAVTEITGTGGYLTTGDFNNDGRLDFASTRNYGETSIYLSNGNGTFKNSSSFTANAGATEMTSGYFNSDAYLDIAVIDWGGNEIGIFFGNNDGTFSVGGAYTVPSLSYLGDLKAEDLNGDGEDELIALRNNDTIAVLIANPDGSFKAYSSYATASGSAGGFPTMAIGDFNSDGEYDLAISSDDKNKLSILTGVGNGTFNAYVSYQVATTDSAGITVNDFDGDGISDIAVLDSGVTGEVSILLGNGSESTSSSTTSTVTFGASALDLLSTSSARSALESLATLQETLSTTVGKLGAFQSRLQTSLGALDSTRLNYASASSRIRDADIAAESAQVIRGQILQQTAASILGQANQIPALALRLLQ